MSPEAVEERARCLQIVQAAEGIYKEWAGSNGEREAQEAIRACEIIARVILSGSDDPLRAVWADYTNPNHRVRI